ncbi:unnamed protein product [Commensalibacter communis]|uniref:hypothetical protein n=1 Tax=Commensalibacter communis TaxID=2972786 RepID=UPI0022FF98AE|nr:hypothetical protein [Commensalibacter communis]CAI3938185.1 unnamed protein product [Commensalibacter communis]
MTLILTHHPSDQFTLLNPEMAGLYKTITAEISQFVSPQHALLFAEPKMINEMLYWYAEGEEVVPWRALSEAKQKQVIQVIQSMLIDISKVAHLHPNSLLLRFFPNYGYFPSSEYIYLVDGHPVITVWGYSGGNGFYNPLINEQSNISRKTRLLLWSKFPWVTALLALFTGVLTSLLLSIYHHSDQVCYATYPKIQEVKEALNGQNKNQALNKKQDELSKSLVLLKKQCKIPPVRSLEPQQTPKLTPLPKEAWEKKDKSMLNGCWHLTTPLKLVARGTDKWTPIKIWQVCFDNSGGGNQIITTMDDITCQGPLSASFQGDKLVIKQPENCKGGFNLVRGTQICTRSNDKEATCLYKDDDVRGGKGVIGIFKR